MSDNKKQNELVKLKEDYAILKKKYSLPEFKFINENFEVENIHASETELLLKAMRKHITEKLFFTLRTLEMLMNPQNAPLFIVKTIKFFNEADKDRIKNLYKKMAYYEMEAFGLEAIYEEKKEAEFIKQVCEDWLDLALDLNKIYQSMRLNYGRESRKSDGSYLG
jgi:hypothetical protein